MNKTYYIYIISNFQRTVLYIGVTSNLYKRIVQHKNKIGSEFAKKYNCTDLVYYECFSEVSLAINREKQLKRWKRAFKDELIRKENPDLLDLFSGLNPFDNNIK